MEVHLLIPVLKQEMQNSFKIRKPRGSEIKCILRTSLNRSRLTSWRMRSFVMRLKEMVWPGPLLWNSNSVCSSTNISRITFCPNRRMPWKRGKSMKRWRRSTQIGARSWAPNLRISFHCPIFWRGTITIEWSTTWLILKDKRHRESQQFLQLLTEQWIWKILSRVRLIRIRPSRPMMCRWCRRSRGFRVHLHRLRTVISRTCHLSVIKQGALQTARPSSKRRVSR